MKTPLDLRLGTPLFFEPYWNDISRYASGTAKLEVKPNQNLAYGAEAGLPNLIEEIRQIHRVIGNAETEGRHIVIGNGATQCLSAAMLADPGQTVYVRPPYFFRFPDIIKATALCEDRNGQHELEIVCSPANPTCERYEPSSGSARAIWDLCYNWPQYLPVKKHDVDIQVFSLAKATGNAGTRIGWAICREKATADAIAAQIEFQTGGVSRDAQDRARLVLKYERYHIEKNGMSGSVFDYGQRELKSRWDRILKLQHPKLRPLNSSGMFLWAEYGSMDSSASDQLLEDSGILAVSGLICGGLESQLRINVGCSDADFEEFIRRMS